MTGTETGTDPMTESEGANGTAIVTVTVIATGVELGTLRRRKKGIGPLGGRVSPPPAGPKRRRLDPRPGTVRIYLRSPRRRMLRKSRLR